ncbi:uncharacterized protein LOC143285148 [Babylonia areolata]|uniref:uncharacterized protein LOC143285148 n=1 Tax=Babylonia areolata TaxID=304850 RepID=UPI003FD0C4AE
MLVRATERNDPSLAGWMFGGSDDLSTPMESSSSVPDSVKGSGHLLTDSSDVSDLGWMIPAVIVGIFAMIGLAFACYLGVRRLELRMLHWCRVHCACCCGPDEEAGRLLTGESYNSLSQTGRKEAVRMRDFRERSPSTGTSRGTREGYVPRRNFNPFDDD